MITDYRLRMFWFLMAIAGAILPMWHLLPWAMEDPGNIWLFFESVTTTSAARAVTVDLFWTAIAFCIFALFETFRTRSWQLLIPVAVTWIIGPSCALPLFLFMRANRQTV